jgi:hypothetical protein
MGRVHAKKAQKTGFKSRAPYYTPPPQIHANAPENENAPLFIRTPQRTAIITCKLLSQRGLIVPQSIVEEITGVPPRSQTRIIASKQVRTLHNQPGPDPRGRKRGLTRSDTRAIAEYLDDSNIEADDKGRPWKDIAKDAGVDLPSIHHFKPEGIQTIEGAKI